MKPIKNYLLLLLAAGSLFFVACGEKATEEASSEQSTDVASKETVIPDAPDEAMKMVLTEISKGNGAVLWQAMPASYQSDVNAIAQLAGSKIDAEIYDKFFVMVGRVGSVLDKQKEFILNSSIGGQTPSEEDVAKFREVWPSVKNMIEALTGSLVSTAAGLQQFEGETFFAETVSSMLKDVDVLTKLQSDGETPSLSDLKDATVKLLESADDQATLEMSMPDGTVETETVFKIENRWVPEEVADGWTAKMTEARGQLQAIDPAQIEQQKSQILSVFTMIDGVLTQIEAAETQEEFDQALQGAMMPMMGVMMMMQNMGGGMPAGHPPAMPPVDSIAPSAP